MNKVLKQMKNIFLKIKKLFLEYKYESSIILLSILVLIVGAFALGFLNAFLIIVIVDCLAIVIPIIIKMYKRDKYGKKELIEERKEETLFQNNINNYYDQEDTETLVINASDIKQIGETKTNVETKKTLREGGILAKVKSKFKSKTQNTKTKKNKKKAKLILKIVLLLFILGVIIGVAVVSIFMYGIIKNAPELHEEDFYSQESSVLLDRDGNEITKVGSEMREKVSYDQLPEVLVDAIIATEDSRFFQHNGFDLPRFLKASLGQVAGRDAGGASTLTMQLSKNNVTDKKYNKAASGLTGIKRKFTDIYVSIFEIEKNYTKQEIIELYVNSYYLGSGSYGVQQASLTYFGKNADELSLAEAAMIAGLFQAPDAYDPYLHPKAAEDRRQTVLYLMERHGYITKEERAIASSMPVDTLLVGNDRTNAYQAFVDTVVAEVIEDTGFDPYTTPMIIYTTMDREKQEHIDKVMNNDTVTYAGETFNWKDANQQAGILVSDVYTGEILAVGGGRNKKGAKSYNYATMIKRQIGSTAKPIYDYGPAIEFNNVGSGTTIIDDIYTYSNGKQFKNIDKKYSGLMTYRSALAASRNIPALKVFQTLDNKTLTKYVKSFGLSPEEDNGQIHEAHAIGGYNGESPLTMAAAYAVYANGGYYIEPYSYTKIVYRDTDEEYIPSEHGQKERVVSAATSYIITSMLQTTAPHVVQRSYINGIPIAAKSGTTDFTDDIKREYKLPSNAVNDYWIVGYSPNYVISLWLGYDNITKGYNNAARFRQVLWRYVANGIITKGSKSAFPTSNDVVSVAIEKECFGDCLASEFTPSDMKTTEYFKKGTAPTGVSDRFARLDNVTNLRTMQFGRTIQLSWTPVATPNAINKDYLTAYFNEMLKDEETRDNWIKARFEYNDTKVGTITYNIYLKNSSGELTYIGTTADSRFDYEITSDGTYEFVVKTSYTIFKDNASTGVSSTINITSDVINASLAGSESVTNSIGTPYHELGIVVTRNGLDVTSEASYTRIIKKGTNIIQNIPYNEAGTYTIEYLITYHGRTYNKVRTVTYQ